MPLLSPPLTIQFPHPHTLFKPKTPTFFHHLSTHPPLKPPPLTTTTTRFSTTTPQYDSDEDPPSTSTPSIPDEWGDKTPLAPEPESQFSRFIPPDESDEWGPEPVSTFTPSTAPDPSLEDDRVLELKRCIVDSVYGSDFGFRVSGEVRAEVAELVSQLEALNLNRNPTQDPGLLDGNWVLVYTAFSELLPLLAVGATPLLKVQRISQTIDTANSTVENSTTLSNLFATFSFSATATFEIRSPLRIQVRFREASFKPPEIKSRFDLPDSVDVFGQKVTLSPVQQFLNPLQEVAASISSTLYGLPPLKIPIPGERTESWLLLTYLDEDFRIARGDGGLFVLVREGSSLLES